jgi:Lectin C-type domain
MRSKYRGSTLLFLLLPVLASAKQEACNSPSAVNYDSCIALSTISHQCFWCKLDDVIHDGESTSSFCTNSVSKKNLNGIVCQSTQTPTNYIYGNFSVTSDGNADGGLSKGNINNEDKLNNNNIRAILKDDGKNDTGGLEIQEYRNLQDSFCNKLAANTDNGNLYGFQTVSLDWGSAFTYALNTLPTCYDVRANLVTVGDATEYEFIKRLVQGQEQQHFWIGLGTDNFRWSDNITPYSFTAWNIGEPSMMNQCVEMVFNGTAWVWNSVRCSNLISFIFEYNCEVCTSLTTHQNNQHVYGKQSKSLTWDSALSDVQSLPMCCGKTAHLVTIQDSFENAIVETLASTENAWLGLSDKTAEGNFTWVDNTPLSFTKWNTGEPNNAFGDEDCVQLKLDGGKWIWNDLNCNEAQPTYIYEYDCDFCATLTLNQQNQHLYRTKTGSFTWSSAQADAQSLPMCCGRTAHIVTIQNSFENAFIESIVKGQPLQSAWIGLSDITSEGNFTWVDNTTFNFNDWNNGEPNNFGGNENCVQVKYNGTEWMWNDINCNDVQPGYILEYDCPQKPTSQPTKTPVQPTKTPVQPTKTPFLPTKTPVLPTKTPILPTKTPVIPTKTPIIPTKTPILPTKTPVIPTKTPVLPTKTPVKPTKLPVRPTRKPRKKPVNPTKKPVRPTTKKPVRPTKKPVRPTKKPRKPVP